MGGERKKGWGAEERRKKRELIIFGYKALVNPTHNFTSPGNGKRNYL